MLEPSPDDSKAEVITEQLNNNKLKYQNSISLIIYNINNYVSGDERLKGSSPT